PTPGAMAGWRHAMARSPAPIISPCLLRSRIPKARWSSASPRFPAARQGNSLLPHRLNKGLSTQQFWADGWVWIGTCAVLSGVVRICPQYLDWAKLTDTAPFRSRIGCNRRVLLLWLGLSVPSRVRPTVHSRYSAIGGD